MQSGEEFLRALDPLVRGRVISVLRSARGMTRDELATEAKASPNTISDWEKGNVKNPRDLFAKLEPVLDLSLSNIRHALTLVRAQQSPGEVAEAPALPYDPAAMDDSAFPPLTDIKGMSAPEIERELNHLSSQFGHTVVRCIVLSAELAARGAQRSS